MSVSNKLNIILGIVCAILMGACIYTFGRYRNTVATVAVYKRQLAESKRQFENTVEQYQQQLDNAEANNDRAKSIVESMGDELQRNDTTVRGTIETLHTLRDYLEDLRDLYSDSSDRGSASGMEVN